MSTPEQNYRPVKIGEICQKGDGYTLRGLFLEEWGPHIYGQKYAERNTSDTINYTNSVRPTNPDGSDKFDQDGNLTMSLPEPIAVFTSTEDLQRLMQAEKELKKTQEALDVAMTGFVRLENAIPVKELGEIIAPIMAEINSIMIK